ncbi:unnamed protein product [Peronospora farinosa]|uniref:Uncharacterized protein n=1 Tax=Peronospora farinosa TaxID=134698 RepID=A0ABN8C907_9STRA|nr:unnamed protein product [Peronospora farinosa]
MTGEHEPVQPVAEENVVEPKSGENAEIHAGEGENDAASLRASATTEEGNVGKKSPTFLKKSRQALNNKINSALSIFNRKTKPVPTTNSADTLTETTKEMTGEHEPVQPVAEENVVEPKSGENAEIHAGEGENDAASLRASATTEEGNVGKKSPTFLKKSRQALNNKINSALSIFNRKTKPVPTTNSADTLTETTKEMTGEHEPVQPVAEENVVEPKSGENAEIHAGEGENDAASLRASATTEEGNVGKKSPTFLKKSRQALNNKINSALSIFNRKTKPVPTTNSADTLTETTKEMTGEHEPVQPVAEENVVEPKSGENAEIHAGEGENDAASLRASATTEEGNVGKKSPTFLKKSRQALNNKINSALSIFNRKTKPVPTTNSADSRPPLGEGGNDVPNTNVVSEATTSEVTGNSNSVHSITEKENAVADGGVGINERDNVVVPKIPGKSMKMIMKKFAELLKQPKSGAKNNALTGEGANDVVNAAQGGESGTSRLVGEIGDDAGGAGKKAHDSSNTLEEGTKKED